MSQGRRQGCDVDPDLLVSGDPDAETYCPDDPPRLNDPGWTVEHHDTLIDAYIASHEVQQIQAAAALRDTAGALEQQCVVRHCPSCLRPADRALPRRTSRVVTLVSVFFAVNVTVPVEYCSECKDYFNISPLSLGYFPSTLKQALDLATAPADLPVLWFDLELLRVLGSLQVRPQILLMRLGHAD